MSKIETIKSGVLVGFSANKSVATSKTEKATNRVNITETGELYFNGKRLGTNDAEDKFFKNAIDPTDGSVKAANVKAADGSDIVQYISSKIADEVLLLRESDFPEETISGTKSLSSIDLETFQKIELAIRSNKRLLVYGHEVIHQEFFTTNMLKPEFGLKFTLSYFSKENLTITTYDVSTTKDNTSYSLKKTTSSLATQAVLKELKAEVNKLKEQLKLA